MRLPRGACPYRDAGLRQAFLFGAAAARDNVGQRNLYLDAPTRAITGHRQRELREAWAKGWRWYMAKKRPQTELELSSGGTDADTTGAARPGHD